MTEPTDWYTGGYCRPEDEKKEIEIARAAMNRRAEKEGRPLLSIEIGIVRVMETDDYGVHHVRRMPEDLVGVPGVLYVTAKGII